MGEEKKATLFRDNLTITTLSNFRAGGHLLLGFWQSHRGFFMSFKGGAPEDDVVNPTSIYVVGVNTSPTGGPEMPPEEVLTDLVDNFEIINALNIGSTEFENLWVQIDEAVAKQEHMAGVEQNLRDELWSLRTPENYEVTMLKTTKEEEE